MINLPDEYIGSSCVVKAKNNDLLLMGTLHKIRENYIDISGTRNELREVPYNLLVKTEIYNTRLGFHVMIGRVYISSHDLIRIIDLNEATNDERREYFRISSRDSGIIYNLDHSYGDIDSGNDYRDLDVDLVDISLGGLMFKTKETLEIGDNFSIVIPAMGDTLLYSCKIRRCVIQPDGLNGYGCEFMEMTNQQEDILYRYILKRQNDQLRRIR